MADPSRGDYSEAQSKHAQKIRTERTIMRMTGLSRQQIRQKLHDFGVLSRQQTEQRQAVIPQAPQVQVGEQKFSPLGMKGGNNAGAVPVADVGEQITAFWAVEDGDSMGVDEVIARVIRRTPIN